MFPFWDIAIAPLLSAAQAQRVVEIGALRGETTELLLDLLGPDAELHVIDPKPQFDPNEHERRFTGRYVFHRSTSHAALAELPAMDAALVDGDHNWHTVHGELELLSAAARAADEPLPLLFLHDVCWPYGRRDLYYDPDSIPAERRQPYRRAGMRPGVVELLDEGGLNPTLDNAVREGGERNGVMTALEDFVAADSRALRVLVLPIYFGLAIVADEARLARAPALAAELDRLEGAEARLELMRLAESLRLRSTVAEHNAVFGGRAREGRAARRYLDVLKGSLLNLHYIESELRLEHAIERAGAGRRPDPAILRDPANHMTRSVRPLDRSREEGVPRRGAPATTSFPYAAMGRRRLDHLERCLRTVRDEAVRGDLVEVGVGRGGGAIFMRGYLAAHELAERRVWAVDEFRNPQLGDADDATADVNMVREGFARFGLLDERVRFLQGAPARVLRDPQLELVALARVDAARVLDLEAALEALYERLAVGAFVIVDGCAEREAREAVEGFRRRRGIAERLERVDARAVVWRKLEERPAVEAARTAADVGGAVPLLGPSPQGSCELSVLVVFHDMRREGERTLHSLSRAYQRGVEELDYEVIAIENGSAPEERLGEELVRSFGPQFRYLDLGEEATPSPAHAVNRAAREARGDVLSVMLDGAHLLTPGVLSGALESLGRHAPAAVATQQWYLGPGQQVEAVSEGYDVEYEERLLAGIDWPTDGYRLFEIGHFIGKRDWFDGIWESNCLFVPRAVAEQVGLMDAAFAMPGGGFANLDLFERVVSTPGLRLVSLLGEGSFHQLHGGTTTNESDAERRARLLVSYHGHYAELRGRPFRARVPIHFVGGVTDSARRTRPRRMGAGAFLRTARQIAEDRLPEKPAPLPAEIEADYAEAYWRSFRWKQARWMGVPLERASGDLLAYQQLVLEGRPDWVVTTGVAPGRDLYIASVCEQAGQARVLALVPDGAEAPQHPRLESLAGAIDDPALAAEVTARVGAEANVAVVFGLDEAQTLMAAFELYRPLVPVGSWVVFEDTIMAAVWPGMGPGPIEAVNLLMRRHPQFAPDPLLGRLGVTFNAGGYLKRMQ